MIEAKCFAVLVGKMIGLSRNLCILHCTSVRGRLNIKICNVIEIFTSLLNKFSIN